MEHRAELTIGAFARASRLSPKALRLYDELGLLIPARVDGTTGYRYYTEAQLDRARLVAWLRRVGMPLARIGEVCDLCETDPRAAGLDIGAYWARVETETAMRRDLVTFLVGQLSARPAGKGVEEMSEMRMRYAAGSDRGLVRPVNQDTAYAGSRLLAVADGFGDDGARASGAAVDALVALEESARCADVLNGLADAVDQVNRAGAAGTPGGSGTTLTAMLWTGSRLALVHVGDTRAYLLRGGEVSRITHDHTLVQSMIDAGSLTVDEAVSHPQRALLLRALDGSQDHARPDLRLHDAEPGDRYLLCSDGLFTVVRPDDIRRVLRTAAEPEDAVRELIALALAAGGPDNVACAVADAVTP
ncbi:MerR family transcriptional regulator [Streptomyces sp. NBC_01716]|uniref:MerR family transcriptional regulator n=1 Tax=Streptomyces sp. NBC_01716 TaxID=2975917 RepID=UPI002E360305|nr:MerR family transcriptional regulator [Streptomyces sp. NBC_01716]